MLQLENPIKYENIILVNLGDFVLIPTSLNERLKPYKEFQGIQYSIAKVVSLLSEKKYLDNIHPKGIYEILNGKILVTVSDPIKVDDGSGLQLEVDVNDVFMLDYSETISIDKSKQNYFNDLKSKLIFDEKLIKDTTSILLNIDLLKYKLLFNTDDLRGFELGKSLSLRFGNDDSDEIVINSTVSNIELINREIYLVCHLPNTVTIDQLKDYIDDEQVIGVFQNLPHAIFNHIKIRLDSKYIVNNLNYVTTCNDKNRYFNNTDILEKYIIVEVLHHFTLRKKIGINDFKFHSIIKQDVDKNKLELIFVLKSINNPQLEYREKMLTIDCRYGTDDLSIKILVDNLIKRLNKTDSLFK